MLKTSCISSSATPPRSCDQPEDRRHGQRVVDLVADVGAEPQQVAEAAGGDVGEAADVDLGAQQLERSA